MAGGGLGVSQYVKRSMDRTRDFVLRRKHLKPDYYDDKVKKKKKFSIHFSRNNSYRKNDTIDWFSILGIYLFVVVTSTFFFPAFLDILESNKTRIPFGEKIYSFMDAIAPFYTALPWIIFLLILLYFIFLCFSYVWGNGTVKIRKNMRKVKLKVEKKQKKRRFKKPASISDKKETEEPIPDRP